MWKQGVTYVQSTQWPRFLHTVHVLNILDSVYTIQSQLFVHNRPVGTAQKLIRNDTLKALA